jgi:hypothetical protein
MVQHMPVPGGRDSSTAVLGGRISGQVPLNPWEIASDSWYTCPQCRFTFRIGAGWRLLTTPVHAVPADGSMVAWKTCKGSCKRAIAIA